MIYGRSSEHEFLRRLVAAQLPIVVDDHYLIGKLRAYVSAGLIKATIPNGYWMGKTLIQPPAKVDEITRDGRITVENLFKLSDRSV